MDKGAHFHCCDLQVHSPRDLAWKGPGAETAGERREYAMDLVVACRSKGIDAIALTDHHDMVFVQYVREARASEKDAEGRLVAPERRLRVFPGMELTLGVPCQALLLFDADFPSDMFPLVRTALAIQQNDDSAPKCVEPRRLESIHSLLELYEHLDRHEFLRGRYIVLPNVSDGGSATLLRQGHAGHYKEMPCVGGYVDGPISKLGTGNIEIITGRNAHYGKKAIGVFQTSDNRRRDHADLGAHRTWVKWATPSAEALRQACLARESRIAHEPPELPTSIIANLSVSNSKFLGPLALEVNPQYSALIGGRGTGKSTVLEYLRWGLCDDPAEATEDPDLSDFNAKRRSLLARTLVPLDANVQVTFILNGVPHTVRRNAATHEVRLKIGNGQFEPCTEKDVRALLPLQAYSQKQLSSVGVRLEELRRFVHAPVRRQLDALNREFSELSAVIREDYARLHRRRMLSRETEKLELELRSNLHQAQQLRDSLQGLDESDQATIAQQAGWESADEVVARWVDQIQRARETIAKTEQTLPPRPSQSVDDLKQLPSTGSLKEIKSFVDQAVAKVVRALEGVRLELDAAMAASGELHRRLAVWAGSREAFRVRYEEAKARSAAHQQTLQELTEVEGRLKALRERANLLKGEIAALGEHEAGYRAARDKWRELYRRRSALLEEQCHALTRLSDGFIRATLRKSIGITAMVEAMRGLTQGTGLRSNKVQTLCDHVASSSDPIGEWFAVLGELELLVSFNERSQGARPAPTPILGKVGFSEADLAKIGSRMTPDAWLDLSLVILEDQPVFDYRAREDEYIPFSEASAGQQATALLWALLNQDGPPLVIDQPEDDLDNQVILKIVEQIWKAKKRRQLIFTSHNANLVVNGDAELVICCDYRVAGEQSSGVIKLEGAIDVPQIRAEIANVMEGGQEAFKLRKDKYGF